ncbi:MAG: hypothetical protein C0443_15495 [Comamonadaceae bacterium]|nr:hypothetical protein [Comamonadaceae bacterium]
MFQTLYRTEHSACHGQRPRRVAWTEELPPDLIGVVVPPVRFDIEQDHHIVADRSLGLDAQGQACFCAFRYVQTALRSEDDEFFYETPVYIETVTAWRLPDRRWITSHKVVRGAGGGAVVPQISLCEGMPR